MNDPKPIPFPSVPIKAVEGHCEKHGAWFGYETPTRAARCPECLKAAIAESNAKAAVETQEAQAANRARFLGVPLRYADATLESVADGGKLSTWAKSDRAHSLVVTGPVGVGKTYAACALAIRLNEMKVQVRYASQASILRSIRATWGQRAETSEESVWRTLTAPHVLIVDDVGAARGNDNDALRISELIDDRYNDRKPTIIVTNLKPEQLKSELGDRAYDRICEGGRIVVMTGESRRRKA